MHSIDIAPEIAARAISWRGGKKTVFGDIDPAKTAHVIVDLQNGFMLEGAAVEVPMAREIVGNVNRISHAVREAGGVNIFLQYLIDEEAKSSWAIWFKDFADEKRVARLSEAFARDAHQFQLHSDLDFDPGDLKVEKTRFGAFIPGTCDLLDILRARGIDTLIITGTATNVCCESTARDAMQLNYKVIFVADGTAALTDTEHNGALNSMSAVFADVLMTDDVVDLMEPAGLVQAAE
jgi:ureidoacrylate peracid hydrolase